MSWLFLIILLLFGWAMIDHRPKQAVGYWVIAAVLFLAVINIAATNSDNQVKRTEIIEHSK